MNPNEGLDLFARSVSEYHDWADVVLIDLEGSESDFNRSAISLADVVVVPSRLSNFDMISAASQIVFLSG